MDGRNYVCSVFILSDLLAEQLPLPWVTDLGLIHLLSDMPLVTLSVKPCMLFFIQTLPRMLCVGDISRVSFLDLFGPIAGATNPIMT